MPRRTSARGVTSRTRKTCLYMNDVHADAYGQAARRPAGTTHKHSAAGRCAREHEGPTICCAQCATISVGGTENWIERELKFQLYTATRSQACFR